MKKILFVFVAFVFIVSCNKSDKKQIVTDTESTSAETLNISNIDTTDSIIPIYNGDTNKTAISDYDYTAPYICPNHCPHSGSDKPGKCPVCGMDLIPNPDYQVKK